MTAHPLEGSNKSGPGRGRVSSYSGDNGGDCIQVAMAAPAIAVRDSKNPGGPQLAFTAQAWTAFTGQLKANR